MPGLLHLQRYIIHVQGLEAASLPVCRSCVKPSYLQKRSEVLNYFKLARLRSPQINFVLHAEHKQKLCMMRGELSSGKHSQESSVCQTGINSGKNGNSFEMNTSYIFSFNNALTYYLF